MSFEIFPPTTAGVGIGWLNQRTESFNTLEAKSVAGRRVSAAQWTLPEREWNWNIPGMDTKHINGNQLSAIVGFYLRHQGKNKPFLIRDTEDYQLTQQVIGIGNGVTTQFQTIRTYGGFVEPIYDVWSQDPNLDVFVEDAFSVLQPLNPADYTVDDFGLVTLDTAPIVGRRVAITVQFFFRVYFKDDSMTSEQMIERFWRNDGINLVSQRD